jgi:hypothetical protein
MKTYCYTPFRKRWNHNGGAMLWTFFCSGMYHVIAVAIAGVSLGACAVLCAVFVTQGLGMALEKAIGIGKFPKAVGWVWLYFFNLTIMPWIVMRAIP